MQLRGQVALVTGGGSGLGAATARALSEAGAAVTVFDRDESRCREIADAIGGLACGGDVQSEIDLRHALDATEQWRGPVRILVNCAGIATPGTTLRRDAPMPLDEFKSVIAVNLVGTFNCIRLAAERMRKLPALEGGECGVIVNTASIAAFDGQIGQAAYSASKAGIAGMMLPLAREFGRYGIRVVAIAPGIFQTPMIDELPEKSRKNVLAQKPPFPPRPGEPREFARMVMALIDNAMVNGTTIRLDGALRMPPLA